MYMVHVYISAQNNAVTSNCLAAAQLNRLSPAQFLVLIMK